MLSTALALAARGLAVFPCAVAAKIPATAHGCLDASTDPVTIRSWWRHQPNLNIGVATGKTSGIFVLDIDGTDGEASLRGLEAEHSTLPPTVETITGGGGRHIWLRYPDQLIKNSVGVLGAKLDVRGEHGYIIVPPSVHPSGKRYCWSVDCASALAPAPEWLIDKIRGHTNGGKSRAQPPEWRALLADGVDEGERDNAATRLCGYLLRHYLDPIVVLEMLQLWNAGLSEDFIADLHESWLALGKAALLAAAWTDPVAYVRVVASLMPRELEATITPVTERMSDAQLEAIIARGIEGGLDPATDD